jgi:GT2 family glycosyltransferase
MTATDDEHTRPAPRVTLIVVNYNGGAALERCIASLTAEWRDQWEIILVDNASTEGSRGTVEKLGMEGKVKTLLLDRNYGYAGAINRACRSSNAQYIAALNMDLEFQPGWLSPLLGFMDDHPEVGAVTPLIRCKDGSSISAAGQRIHVTGLGFNRTRVSSQVPEPREPFEVSGIHGAAFLVRREAFVNLGGMDEEGFLYHEDVNFSWLLRLAGFSIYCIPASVVYHDYFLSMYPEKFFLLERNRLAMLFSYLEPETLLALAPVIGLSECLTWGYALLRGKDFLSAKFAAYQWVSAKRNAIGKRRIWAARRRVASDWQVLRKMSLSYDVGQMLTLAKERGLSRRMPIGGPTVKVKR